MSPLTFIAILSVLVFIPIAWGFKILPRENWQILAVLPKAKDKTGHWTGLNLTWYGLLSANAYTFGVLIFIILGSAAGIPLSELTLLSGAMLAVCLPASSLLARWVEKKKNTLTVGGAVFVGTLAFPWMVKVLGLVVPRAADLSPLIPMAAMAIGYTFGEGMGRLACVSFGCCYGRPVSQCPAWARYLFSGFYMIFAGETKKIAYAHHLTGEKVVPIQIITAVIYCGTGLFSTHLFLISHYFAALVIPIFVTQIWRFLSEFLRADFRGNATITPYQVMALISMAYTLGVGIYFPAVGKGLAPDLDLAFHALWQPGTLVFIQLIWLISFFHTGRSSVTGAKLSFHVHPHRI